jgi:hypothetical protein
MIVAKTDEKALAAVEEELKRNPKATLDELWEKAKAAVPAVGRLDRRQFNARYPLQVKRRLLALSGRRRRRGGRKAKAKGAATTKRRGPGRPKGGGRGRRSAASADGASPVARDAVRQALIAFATEVVSAADNPKQLIKTLSGVDSYVDKVTKALS